MRLGNLGDIDGVVTLNLLDLLDELIVVFSIGKVVVVIVGARIRSVCAERREVVAAVVVVVLDSLNLLLDNVLVSGFFLFLSANFLSFFCVCGKGRLSFGRLAFARATPSR